MNFAENYFQKYSYLTPQIKEPPSGLLRFSVVIPAYLEEDIVDALVALKNANKPKAEVEVIVVVNYSENDSNENKKRNIHIYRLLKEWSIKNSSKTFKFHSILAEDLPKKHAGVGLARKIGMDEAVARFGLIHCPNGTILSLDADAKVDENYFTSLEEKMSDTDCYGICIYQFAHELEGREFDQVIYDAAAEYELHLRYYRHILHYSGFPYSNYTIGSCFGVNAKVYASHGGMNRRQAGEDFYFLNKVFPNTNLLEITDSCILLSPRPSMRVPFGTGPVVSRLSKQGEEGYCTYVPEAFFDLKCLFDSIETLYNEDSIKNSVKGCSQTIREFLSEQKFFEKIIEIKANTSSLKSFIKRFYSWFDGFKVVKYLNYSHSEYYQKIPVQKAVSEFLMKIDCDYSALEIRQNLQWFRALDREGKKLGI